MIKKYYKWMILSTLLVLSPMFFGLLIWDRLPELVAIHWGMGGIGGVSGAAFAVFLLPTILFAFNIICIFFTLWDNERRKQNEKIIRVAFLLMPIISIYTGVLVYSTAFGFEISVLTITAILFGVLFILIGNYMPKCKRNSTIGIRIVYTLANEENWNRTHRFSGKVFVAMGVISLIFAFLPEKIFFIGFIALMLVGIALPFGFSYKIYRDDIKSGRATREDYKLARTKKEKRAVIVSVVIGAVILIALIPIMFFGSIEYEFGTNELSVSSTFAGDFSLKYADVESIELREGRVSGTRVMGYGSAKLLLGTFESDELGKYARYTYTGDNGAVVIKTKDGYIVLGDETPEKTEELFSAIAIRIKVR